MSASSGTTLISPTATAASTRSAHTAHHPPRRQSSHASHSHHPKRRQSHHHVHHAHGGHAGNRRTSEGEHGRRAMVAGLAMQVMDAGSKAMQRTRSGDRPLPKSSKSETHLPTLSRTTSISSNASTRSNDNHNRPKGKGRAKNGESVQIVIEDGKEEGQVIDSEEEGWESGEEEVKETKPKSKSKSTKKDPLGVRRTVSDTQAEVPPKAGDVKAIIDPSLDLRQTLSGGSNHSDHPHLTQRTTGFAGTVTTPAADPTMEIQAMKNISTPHYNDPTHIMPAHQVRHQQSARSIRMTPNPSATNIPELSVVDGEKTPKPGSMARSGSGQGQRRQSSKGDTKESNRPRNHATRSTEGSGSPDKNAVKESPSFPFPKMESPQQIVSSPLAMDPAILREEPEQKQPLQQPTPPTSADSSLPKTRKSEPPLPSAKPSEPRQRIASGAEPRLRHRYSNSSLRSIQSLRAPPHPLNSPAGGFRSGMPTVATSRPGSILNSPVKGERRGTNVHHPPIAPPVVYREVVKGEGYSENGSTNEGSSQAGSRATLNGPKSSNGRKGSFSQRSLQGLMSLDDKGRTASNSVMGVHAQPPIPSKRRTAIEAAAAAAKMPTTSDPVEYHHSMGYPASSAESAHLISRFLPQRKTRNLDWEITSENSEEHSGIGLSRGEYRDAHESLVRMMKEITIGGSAPPVRTASRTLSYQTLMGPGGGMTGMSSMNDEGGSQVGTVRGRNGTLAVAKGGWKGRTPFEMSLDRCMAQRPQRAMAGL